MKRIELNDYDRATFEAYKDRLKELVVGDADVIYPKVLDFQVSYWVEPYFNSESDLLSADAIATRSLVIQKKLQNPMPLIDLLFYLPKTEAGSSNG